QFILARRDRSPPDSTTGPSSRPDDDTSEKVIHESSYQYLIQKELKVI
ncbi:hypothetical protein Tco_0677239, partial [Tanacetum coccineum]